MQVAEQHPERKAASMFGVCLTPHDMSTALPFQALAPRRLPNHPHLARGGGSLEAAQGKSCLGVAGSAPACMPTRWQAPLCMCLPEGPDLCR